MVKSGKSMKLLTTISNFRKKQQRVELFGGDHRQEALVRLGREQFATLLKRGLSVPIVLL